MPTRSGDQLLARLEKLCREHRIIFSNDANSSQWPASHRKTFETARLIGAKTFEDYASASADLENEPWKVQVKSLALLLVEKARRLIERNESTWRHACEPIVLDRLESEVCCKVCRNRLWRSYIEVMRENDSTAARQLEGRQKARQPCRCPRMARSNDHLEAAGLNPIFGYRADEEVLHAENVAQRLEKGEKPDRVYGLRQTRNIENLLYDAVKRQFQDNRAVEKQVHEVLGLNQPLRQTGDHILFPFLVLEAKSAHSSNSWHRIHMQTAFSIRTLLETQNLLRKTAGTQSKWKSGPLVWFIANKGEDWRLYAAYMQPAPDRVVNVWNGSVTTRDGALQLLLLVDYIFDWARDIYREDIIRELRILATGSNDTASAAYTDSDIFSTRQIDPLDPLDEPHDEENNPGSSSAQEEDPFAVLDSSAGVFRHASFVEFKYCCIFVTRDNVETLLKSVKQTKLQTLCRQALTQTQESLSLTLPTLDAIERQWTGRSRLTTYRPDAARFFTTMTFTTYISSSWHLVRELFAIAIAENAWSALVAASKLKQDRGNTKAPISAPEAQEDAVLNVVKHLQAGTPPQVLHAAIHRRAVKVCSDLHGQIGLWRDDGELRRLVHFVYEYFQKGKLEPQEPFLRVSKNLVQQHNSTSAAEPAFFNESALGSIHGCVLVTATCSPEPNVTNTEICAYLTSGAPALPAQTELSSILLNAFETCDVYHTTRSHWSSILSPLKRLDKSYRNIWNLRWTYGVCSRNFDNFLDLIHRWGSELPITQGSPRGPTASGCQLYHRNFATWEDPRYSYLDRKERMFVLYKLFSREMQFWNATAVERRAQGLSCCIFCASLGDHDICDACKTFLEDPHRYSWLKRCLVGAKAFKVEPSTGSDLEEVEELSRSENRYVSVRHYIEAVCEVTGHEDDVSWDRYVRPYPELDKPFTDIGELQAQWIAYKTSWDSVRTKRYVRRRKSKRRRLNDGNED